MERGFHTWIKSQVRYDERIKIGIGDDAAVLNESQLSWVVSTDLIADGVHFETQQHALDLIGRKVMAVNLSDLAAMGATPVAALLDFLLPHEFSLNDSQQIFHGCQRLADQFNVQIIGGDTNRWDGKLVLGATVLGVEGVTANGPTVWQMNRAKVGDQIIASGSFGGSILGHHLEFTPQVDLASYLIKNYEISAATDVSDSLSLDLAAIGTASQVGVELDSDRIPIAEAAKQLSISDGITPLQHALIDGEDFELILTASPAETKRIINEYSGSGKLSVIGRIVSTDGFWLCHSDGRRESFAPAGYSH
jgi:thiamine-monophosphate kinase